MSYEELLNIKSITEFTEYEQLRTIGQLFDLSLDRKNIGDIELGIYLSNSLDEALFSECGFTDLNYFLSNGWSYLRKLKYQFTKNDWNFQMDELTKEIFYLRKAMASEGFTSVGIGRQCQIYTNLGNVFSYIGRFVEAQEYWVKALVIAPSFSMALGNAAWGLFHYAGALFDTSHQNLFLVSSFYNAKQALIYSQNLQADALVGVQQLYNKLFPVISEQHKAAFESLRNWNLGEEKELRDYRIWCLENRLYINPLNDLGPFPVASYDVLHLPTIITEWEKPPVFLNLFNQIKQEFGTARLSFYESTRISISHYSDADIQLVDTMEGFGYSYRLEQLKIAYRLGYSILDKIAYFVNDYLGLKIEFNKVNFRIIWYSDYRKKIVNSLFANSQNWALRGLYWLSRDLYEKDDFFDSVLEPDSKEIATIRNFIEHKAFNIVTDASLLQDEDYDLTMNIAYSITRSDFEKKTMKILKLSRAAIVYLSLAIHHEEKRKLHGDKPILPIILSNLSRDTDM